MMMMMKVGTLDVGGEDRPNTRSPQPVYKPVQPHPLLFHKFAFKIRFKSSLLVILLQNYTQIPRVGLLLYCAPFKRGAQTFKIGTQFFSKMEL